MIDGLLVIAISVLLAYANGAKDISKGIATLVGSGVADYRRAILWGTVGRGSRGRSTSPLTICTGSRAARSVSRAA
ncbi:MAG: hypothetical protein HYX76_15435 [Acidobacteria bacterium]|nr:hypothetical protein [Acidobacteriota bacterium]